MDELLGSLLTFEMSLEGKPEKKNMGIALQFLAKKEHDDPDKDFEDSLAECISLLFKQFE